MGRARRGREGWRGPGEEEGKGETRSDLEQQFENCARITREMHHSDRTKKHFPYCYFTPETRGSRPWLGFTDYFFTVSCSVLTRHLLKLLV